MNLSSYSDLSTLIGIIALMAAASERLVETIKKLIPSLSSVALPTDAAVSSTQLPSASKDHKNSRREGILSLISILAGILTAGLGYWAGTFGKLMPSKDPLTITAEILFLGILVSGGSRLWNPLVEYLKAIKDIKAGNNA
jgi:hypothetical protein